MPEELPPLGLAHLERLSAIEALRQRTFPVGSGGSLRLLDVWGSDAVICRMARLTSGSDKGKTPAEDRALLRYLQRMGHSTPREFAGLIVEITCPMHVWRQLVRHRTSSINEYSTRYSEAIDECETTPADGWRLQSTANRQGSSGGVLEEWPKLPDRTVVSIPPGVRPAGVTPGQYLSQREQMLHAQSREVYEERLALGVAKELARKDLPLSNYTKAAWSLNLHNWLHLLSLRMDAHAQQETREFATIIGQEMVAPLFPVVWEAFEDFDPRRGGLLLSRLDLAMLRSLIDGLQNVNDRQETGALALEQDVRTSGLRLGWTAKASEYKECVEKLRRLGLDLDTEKL